MEKKIFEGIVRGAEEAVLYAKAQKSGEVLKGFKVHIPEDISVKEIRNKLGLSQSEFAEIFGFSLSSVKHWEAKRREPERAAKIYLHLISRNPSYVLELAK